MHVGVEDPTERENVLNLLQIFKDMWSGSLGLIACTKHCIDLIEGASPI